MVALPPEHDDAAQLAARRAGRRAASVDVCAIRTCDAAAVADGTLELASGERIVPLCARHVHLAKPGAIFTVYLKPDYLENAE